MIAPQKSLKRQQKRARLSTTRKQAEDYGLIATAYHESAHTIVGLAHFFQVFEASVSSHERGDTNYCIYDYDYVSDPELRRMIIMAELKTIYAGLIGERMYYQDICGSSKFPMHLKAGSYYDTNLCSKLIRRHNMASPGAGTVKLKKDIRTEMERFLMLHWKSVKLVAHAIYRKKKLNFSDLKYILTRSEDKLFWKDRFKKIQMILGGSMNLSERTVKSLIT